MLEMFSRSDTNTAHVVILALGTTERDARDVAVALTTELIRSSNSPSGNYGLMSRSALNNFEWDGSFSFGTLFLMS